ncbi:hypothetical protein AB0M37_27325 [Micromonospora chalcea]
MRKVREVTKDRDSPHAKVEALGPDDSLIAASSRDRSSRQVASEVVHEDSSAAPEGMAAGAPESSRALSNSSEAETKEFVHELLTEHLQRTRDLLENFPLAELAVLHDFAKSAPALEVKGGPSFSIIFGNDDPFGVSREISPYLMGGLARSTFSPRSVIDIRVGSAIDHFSPSGLEALKGRRVTSAYLDTIERLVTSLADRLGGDHPTVLVGRRVWAQLQAEAGDIAGAHAALQAVVSDLTRVAGATHPETEAARVSLNSLEVGRSRK